MKLLLGLSLILAITSVYSSRASSALTGSRTRAETRPTVKYFDDFLIEYLSNPPAVRTNSRDSRLSSTMGNGTRDSLRRYNRRRHDRNRNLQTRLRAERENGTLSQNSSSIPSPSLRASVAEPIRRHSRRNSGSMPDFLQNTFLDSITGVNRDHWSCCELGFMAGDKGFLCDAQFYNSRILDRNANRAHNRRVGSNFFRNGAPTVAGRRLLVDFSQCVSSRDDASDFDGCCERATRVTERRLQLDYRLARTAS